MAPLYCTQLCPSLMGRQPSPRLSSEDLGSAVSTWPPGLGWTPERRSHPVAPAVKLPQGVCARPDRGCRGSGRHASVTTGPCGAWHLLWEGWAGA